MAVAEGVGSSVGVGVAVVVAVGRGVGVSVAVAAGRSVGVGVAVAVGEGVSLRVDVVVGVGVTVSNPAEVGDRPSSSPENTPAAKRAPTITPATARPANNHFQLAPNATSTIASHPLILALRSGRGHGENLLGILLGYLTVSIHVHDQVCGLRLCRHPEGN